MRRARIPDFLESCANHPRVRPFIGPGDHRFSAGESWARTVALEWREGGVVFLDEGDGTYSAHWVFLPDTPDVVGKGKQAVDYLFTQTDAQRIVGKTPTKLRHAIKAARAVGLRHTETLDGYSHCELTREQWIQHRESA